MVRVKYRYLVASVSVSGGVTGTPGWYPGFPMHAVNVVREGAASGESQVYKAIRKSVQLAHGSFGLGRVFTRLRIVYWNPFSGLLIIRVLRGLPTEQLTSALTLITSMQVGDADRPALIDILHRSGTVRACQKFLVAFYRRQLSGCVLGVKETAIGRAVTRQLIASEAPNLDLELG